MTAAPHLLALCGSMKPAPGDPRPSACRSILRAATGLVSSVFPHIEMLDIREADLPPFQGLAPGDHPDPRVMDCHARIRAASGLILSVPAYWGGVGGAFKSFVETVSGPAYDTGAASPFAGLPAVGLIVGADPASAEAAAAQLPVILGALGVGLASPLVVVDDPAAPGAAAAAVQRLVGAVAGLARDLVATDEVRG